MKFNNYWNYCYPNLKHCTLKSMNVNIITEILLKFILLSIWFFNSFKIKYHNKRLSLKFIKSHLCKKGEYKYY